MTESNPEEKMRRFTVKACNVREHDVVIRVGKRVRAVKIKANGEVRIKLKGMRKDVVLEEDRLVRINRPVATRKPTEKKKRRVRMTNYWLGRKERAAIELGTLRAKHYPKPKKAMANA